MGIQSAPAFSMWAFANKSPAPFPLQQVWASSFAIGLILFTFTAFQGMGGHLLGANLKLLESHPEYVNPVLQHGLVATANPEMTGEEVNIAVAEGLASLKAGTGPGKLIDIMATTSKQGNLVPGFMSLIGDTMPWLMALLAVCALAAMQSTGAAYMSTAGSMMTRDIIRRYVLPSASDVQQKFFGRLGVIIIVLAALVVATFSTDALVLLGGLAVAYGFQMWPALIAVCWWPFLTRQGVVVGLIAGLIAVTMTESIGAQYVDAWGRWPLTIHSAGWGIFFNLGLAILISAVTQNKEETAHRMTYHNFLREHATLPAHKRGLIPVAWIVTLAWFFLGIGPGVVIGNWIFGSPTDPSTWLFGIPSIWAWQLLFWALGVGMMWFLAVKMEMSTVPDTEINELLAEAATAQPAASS
jgi:hypothetical protein